MTSNIKEYNNFIKQAVSREILYLKNNFLKLDDIDNSKKKDYFFFINFLQ